MLLSFDIKIKEVGGIPLKEWDYPIVLTMGSHVKLQIAVKDCNGFPFDTSLYTVKMKIRDGTESVLSLVPTALNHNCGLWELVITPAIIAQLKAELDQDVEMEVALAATPTTKSYYKIEDLISVTLPLFGG